MDWFHEEKASIEEDKRYSLLQWIRWMMGMVWVKLHTIWRNQGSHHTRILGNAFKILYLLQFEARSRERLSILPNTVTCSRSLQHTTCSLHWESGMKTTDEVHQKVRLTPRVPRVVLKSNGLQDPLNQDARSSWEPSRSYGETCNNTVDHRIAGEPLSAVEQQNTVRENKVKRLIEKFENHKHKESFIQNLKQTQKINKFSKESQDLIADMNSTEIFELCENSSKHQCLECNTIPPKINSNDFGSFWNELADSNSNFVVAEVIFWTIRIFGVFKVQSHTMWPYMCMRCGLFVPTQFHFECCGVFDESR